MKQSMVWQKNISVIEKVCALFRVVLQFAYKAMDLCRTLKLFYA